MSAGHAIPETADWRRSAVVYQVYPRSFADAGGDGVGDLNGIASHLPDLAELGVDAIWLSPFYPSPQADAGYDVADYRGVDPLFGTMDDFDALLERTHQLGLKLIIDLVPNQCSDQHPWFRDALAAAPGAPERERYIFRDGRGPDGSEPPNNWCSAFGGPAWTRTPNPDGTPGQWYLHLFDTHQPDWNWESPEVREEFLSVIRFWLDKGVDGMRVDVAEGLVKEPGLPDADLSKQLTNYGDMTTEVEPEPLNAPMWNRDGVHEIYRSWRRLFDQYEPSRMLVAESWVRPLRQLARYVRPDEMHQAFNFDFLGSPWDERILRLTIDRSLRANGEVGAPTTWVLSNHDVVRPASRFGLPQDRPRPNGIGAGDPQPDAVTGLRRARAAALLMLGLPGSAYLFQGEELGLPEHTTMDDSARHDPMWLRFGTFIGRDGCRVPIPWVGGAPANGFSPSGKTWLPQPESFEELARDRQEGVPDSTLELYRTALRLRREHALGAGSLTWLSSPAGVLKFENEGVVVMANLSEEVVPLPPGEVIAASEALPEDGTLPVDVSVWITQR